MNPESLHGTISALRRRLVIERLLFGAVIICLLAALFGPSLWPRVWAVYVDERPVVAMRDRRDLERVLARIVEARAPGDRHATFVQKVSLRPGDPSRVSVADEHTAMERLDGRLTLQATRGVIYVEGDAAVALPTRAEAEQVLEQVKAALTPPDLELSQPPELKEAVEVRVEPAAQEIWADVETAVAALRGDGEKGGREHVVQQGETGWNLAERYGLTVDELKALNPRVNLDRLRIGQKLAVARGEPPLVTVVSQGKLVRSMPSPFEVIYRVSPQMYVGKRLVTQTGKPGVRRVVFQVTCENGRVVSRQVLSSSPVQAGRPQIVVNGGRPRPRL